MIHDDSSGTVGNFGCKQDLRPSGEGSRE